MLSSMISIRKLMGRDDRFLHMLETSAEEAERSVRGLSQALKSRIPDRMEALAAAMQEQKLTADRIEGEVVRTDVTALDKQDILAIAHALGRVPKAIEHFAQRWLICRPLVRDADFSKQVALVEAAAAQARGMVANLGRGIHLDRTKEQDARLQRLEAEADDLTSQLLSDLYQQVETPMRVLALKDLYEWLDKVVDRCRNVGGAVTHVVLKNS